MTRLDDNMSLLLDDFPLKLWKQHAMSEFDLDPPSFQLSMEVNNWKVNLMLSSSRRM